MAPATRPAAMAPAWNAAPGLVHASAAKARHGIGFMNTISQSRAVDRVVPSSIATRRPMYTAAAQAATARNAFALEDLHTDTTSSLMPEPKRDMVRRRHVEELRKWAALFSRGCRHRPTSLT